jgi:hypothetical protein
MTDKPKPLTKAEWEATRLETYQPYSTRGRINATLAAVRKVAEEYDCKPNPCAAAIMGVLEGKP